MMNEWLEDWDCINELITYSSWCKKELPKVIPNCRMDSLILDLTDAVSFKPSVVAYGPYSFIKQILENSKYTLTHNDMDILDNKILRYLISNAILNSSMVYKYEGYNETNMGSLINMINNDLPKEIRIKTDSITIEMMYHYWRRLKNVLDINIHNYFKIPVDHIYETFNQHGLLGLNSPDELFNLIAREGMIDYEFIKELQWMDKRIIVPEVPVVISNHEEVIAIKLEVIIYKEGHIIDGKL